MATQSLTTTTGRPVTLRVLDIVEGTSVDGPGLRTSVYLAGCNHRCPGCHNPQSWDMAGGDEMTIDEIVEIIERNGFNITLSGGDPLLQLPAVAILAERLHSLGYKIWCYTGYTWEEALALPGIGHLLPFLQVMVDGPFDLTHRDTTLFFRGSPNQRLIDVARSLSAGKPIEFPLL